jgi:hypothetical protein
MNLTILKIDGSPIASTLLKVLPVIVVSLLVLIHHYTSQADATTFTELPLADQNAFTINNFVLLHHLQPLHTVIISNLIVFLKNERKRFTMIDQIGTVVSQSFDK